MHYLFSLFKVFTGLGIIASVIGAAAILTEDAPALVLLAMWLSCWWGHSVMEGGGWAPLRDRPVLNRILTVCMVSLLIGGAGMKAEEGDVLIFSFLAVATLVTLGVWLLIVEHRHLLRDLRQQMHI